MINIGSKYQAISQGGIFVEDVDGEYRVIEFTASEIPEGLNYRVVITPLPINENPSTIAMEYEWQFQLGGVWETLNGKKSAGKLRTRATKSEFVNLNTGEVVAESEAKTDGVFNEGYNTSYYHIMNAFPINGSGIIGSMSVMADLFFEMHFNNKVLPKYVQQV